MMLNFHAEQQDVLIWMSKMEKDKWIFKKIPMDTDEIRMERINKQFWDIQIRGLVMAEKLSKSLTDEELCDQIKDKRSNGFATEEIISRFMKQTTGHEYPYRWRRRTNNKT